MEGTFDVSVAPSGMVGRDRPSVPDPPVRRPQRRDHTEPLFVTVGKQTAASVFANGATLRQAGSGIGGGPSPPLSTLPDR